MLNRLYFRLGAVVSSYEVQAKSAGPKEASDMSSEAFIYLFSPKNSTTPVSEHFWAFERGAASRSKENFSMLFVCDHFGPALRLRIAESLV